MKRAASSMQLALASATMPKVQRQPQAATSAAAIAGTSRLPRLPPLDAIATAVPRRRVNQRETVALHGTQATLMPSAATTPKVRLRCQGSVTKALLPQPRPSSTAPMAITGRGPKLSVARPVAALNAL